MDLKRPNGQLAINLALVAVEFILAQVFIRSDIVKPVHG